MKLVYLLSPLAVGQTAAYLVTPDGTAAPGADPDCTEWVQDSYALTCEIIEAGFGITEAQFVAWVGVNSIHVLISPSQDRDTTANTAMCRIPASMRRGATAHSFPISTIVFRSTISPRREALAHRLLPGNTSRRAHRSASRRRFLQPP